VRKLVLGVVLVPTGPRNDEIRMTNDETQARGGAVARSLAPIAPWASRKASAVTLVRKFEPRFIEEKRQLAAKRRKSTKRC
jgi:hypothetical protein